MKKIIFTLSIVFSIAIGYSQDLQEYVEELKSTIEESEVTINSDGTISVQNIINLDETYTKDVLYNLVKDYIVNNYNNPSRVIQLDDKERGTIIVKGTYETTYCDCSGTVFIGSAMEYTPKHTLQIDIKEGRIRITIIVTEVRQKSGGIENIPLKYTDFVPTDFFPYTLDGKVFTGNYELGTHYTKGNRQLKANYHEGMVMLQIIRYMYSQLTVIEGTLMKKGNLYNNLDNDW